MGGRGVCPPKVLCPRLCLLVPTEPDERCDGDHLALLRERTARKAGTVLSREGKRFGRTCPEKGARLLKQLDIGGLIRRLRRKLTCRRWV